MLVCNLVFLWKKPFIYGVQCLLQSAIHLAFFKYFGKGNKNGVTAKKYRQKGKGVFTSLHYSRKQAFGSLENKHYGGAKIDQKQ